MREKDKIDDILVANRASDEDDLKKGIRVNVTSPLALSAQFIRLAEAGKLEAMSPLVLMHQKVGRRLALIEAKLLVCNSPEHLAEFEKDCRRRRVDFATKLRQLAKTLEDKKARLRKRLRAIEEKVFHKEPALAGSLAGHSYPVPPGPISLVSKHVIQSDPYIEVRDKLIAAHHKCTAREICKRLDLEFARDLTN